MKIIIIFLSVFLAFFSLNGQTFQEGIARELNSNLKPLKGVFIKFESSPSTNSDARGIFQLYFQDKKAGDVIFLEDIQKSGYELVNHKDFEITRISNNGKLPIDVILAKKGVVEIAKREYYDISDKALITRYEKQKENLKLRLKSAQLNQLEFENKFNELQIQYNLQKDNLNALADRFARVNFDDFEPVYEEALNLFKEGKISKAIDLLESVNPIQRTTEIIEAQKKIDRRRQELDQDQVLLNLEIKKQIKTVRFLADMYSANFNPKKAEILYDQLLLLDSSNIEILVDASNYYFDQHLYDKAKISFQKIINNPKVPNWRIAASFCYLGDVYSFIGDLSKALVAYESYFDTILRLHKENPSSSYYKEGLAISNSKIGYTYFTLGSYKKTLNFYQNSFQIINELYESNPKNSDYKAGLSNSFERLAQVYDYLGSSHKALAHFENNTQLRKELYKEFPKSIDLKNALAISYGQLGSIYLKLDSLQKAYMSYEKFNQLELELYEKFPQNIEFKNRLTLSYAKLGEIYVASGDSNRALSYFKEFNKLNEELHLDYPQNVDFKIGLAASNAKLAQIEFFLENYENALNFIEHNNKLIRELHGDYPKNVRVKNRLATSYAQLGTVHQALGNIDRAIDFLENCNILSKELYEESPLNIDFKNDLIASYNKLGYIYTSVKAFKKALVYYETELKLIKELQDSFPKNLDVKVELAMVYVRLGIFCFEKLDDKTKTQEYLLESEKIWKELIVARPKNTNYKENLSLVRKDLRLIDEASLLEIKNQIHIETDTFKLYQLYKDLCDMLRIKVKTNNQYKPDLAEALNSKAWYGFFFKEFAQSEIDIREGMELGTNNKYLASNLPLALLFQGKLNEAQVVYNQYKAQIFDPKNMSTFRDVFWGDLNMFETAGIIPLKYLKDVEKIRTLLKEE